MKATFVSLPAWPYPPRPQATTPFRMGWDDALDSLEREIELVGGDDVLIGVVLDPAYIGISGKLKVGWFTKLRHVGAEVSFSTPDGKRLAFHTDGYKELRQNVRAIAAGLEALRAVDRYGITSSAEQYAGFAQLAAGGPDPARGKVLVEREGGIRAALMRYHPDRGGNDRDFADVQAYRESVGGQLT